MNASSHNEGNVSVMDTCVRSWTINIQVLMTVLYSVIFPVSLLGNSLVLYVVFKKQNMRSALNLLIVNMAIADLLMTIFTMPYSVAFLFAGSEWFSGVFGLILCKTIHFSMTASIASSVITLVVLTVDRFVTIVFVWKSCLNLRTSKVSLIIIWVISLAIMGIYLQVYTVEQTFPGDDTYECYPDWAGMPKDFSKLFALGFFAILYAIPLLLMAVLYTIIVHKLWRNRFAQSTGSGGDVNINNSKKRVVKMLVTVTLFFAICWFPLHTIHYYMYFNSQSYECLSLYVILLSFWLGHANSAINPVLYVIFNKTFRRAFLDALYIVSFSTVNLMSTTGRRSSRRPSTTQNNGRSMSNNHKQPPSPLPQALSQRKMYGYGKLRPQSETTKSRSSEGDSQMHGKKIARYSMLVVIDKMTSV
ncbi:QRFP-like peptide receptor [Montipora capricornis]|uniref:QRFP-like peptide receptor n=1 Tax=Montipora capricornis TaxID=246305 RepID=UPI0035F1056B